MKLSAKGWSDACKDQTPRHESWPNVWAGAFIHLEATKTVDLLYKGPLWWCWAEARVYQQPLAILSFPTMFHHICHDVPGTVTIQCSLIPSPVRIYSPRGVHWYWTSAKYRWAGSRYKCSCNHITAYTMIVLHCRIKRFFHTKCRSQTQSLLYLLTHFIKFTSFLLCLCTSVPSAVCTKSYWHFNIKLLWQEDIPLAK